MTSTTVKAPPRKRASKSAHDIADIEDSLAFTPAEARQVRKELLAWYDAKHRCLPWRKNVHSLHQSPTEPMCQALQQLSRQEFLYRVWVSEMMLQQTQVSRASAYYQRWISRWPTVQALAAAEIQQVNEMWSGLGYYRRARYLFDGSQYIVSHLGGQLPLTSTELQRIPGIGAYTSAAMASIAAGERVAAIDANVIRVLSRLRCLSADPSVKDAKLQHSQLSAMLLDPDRPGDFNQAMMELGAVVCTGSSKPACSICPIRRQCRAVAQQQAFLDAGGDASSMDAPLVTQYPAKGKKVAKKLLQRLVCVVKLLRSASQSCPAETLFLLVKRKDTGLLAGLWEFPGQEWEAGESTEHDRVVMDAYIQQQLGIEFANGADLQIRQRRQLGHIGHEFSHISCTMHVDLLVLQGKLPVCSSKPATELRQPTLRWVEQKALLAEGLSSRERKICNLLEL